MTEVNQRKEYDDEEDDDPESAYLRAMAEDIWKDDTKTKDSDEDFEKKSYSSKKKEKSERRKRKRPSNESDPVPTSPRPQTFSVHITQLPYKATEFDLQKYLFAHGCTNIVSIRFVYDQGDTFQSYHQDRQQQPSMDKKNGRVFRGVAFCDLKDQPSYTAALALNKTYLMGRRINVRPTKTVQELKTIVQQTREQLQNDKNKKSSTELSNEKKIPVKKKTPRKARSSSTHKLTKKERNRRAAIIQQLQRRRKKS